MYDPSLDDSISADALVEKPVFWKMLCNSYGYLYHDDARKILKCIIDEKEPIRSTILMTKTEIDEARFHTVMRQLVQKLIVRRITKNRSVYYQISPFAAKILEITPELLKKVEEEKKHISTLQ